MPWIAVATIGGAYLGSQAAGDAADSAAAGSLAANQLSQAQYDQNRQDLSPYRQVAVGQEQYEGRRQFDLQTAAWEAKRIKLEASSANGGQDARNAYEEHLKRRPNIADFNVNEVTGYTGGALNTLADYGQSQVNPNQYIRGTHIPTYQATPISGLPDITSNIPEYDVNGQIRSKVPSYDVQQNIDPSQNIYDVQGRVSNFGEGARQNQYDPNFDITKDPSYQFRLSEQENAINRNMAGMGKLTSGNRLEEIMKRSGEMASQEYADAYGRNQQDFQIGAGVNTENYGRDVSEYGLKRGAEDTRYSQQMDRYNALTGQNQVGYGRQVDQYGRDITDYSNLTANEQARYGRKVDQYGRDITDYSNLTAREQSLYGRNVDLYNRAYAQNVDQYGRDLTQYNANVSQEAGMYGRSVDNYSRLYGREGDYLNRLASLSNVGQTAATNTAQFGAQNAQTQAGNLVAAGQTQAAAAIGQASAITGAVGNLAQYYGAQQQPVYNPYMQPSYNTQYMPVTSTNHPYG